MSQAERGSRLQINVLGGTSRASGAVTGSADARRGGLRRAFKCYLEETRPLLNTSLREHALILSGYGERFSPSYVGNWVKKCFEKADIDRRGSCHLLRHSCATHMHENGADIRYIQQMLGHARLDTTQIYTEVSIEQLKEVHGRTHPACLERSREAKLHELRGSEKPRQ